MRILAMDQRAAIRSSHKELPSKGRYTPDGRRDCQFRPYVGCLVEATPPWLKIYDMRVNMEMATEASAATRRILVISPTPTHPTTAGNRVRILRNDRLVARHGASGTFTFHTPRIG